MKNYLLKLFLKFLFCQPPLYCVPSAGALHETDSCLWTLKALRAFIYQLLGPYDIFDLGFGYSGSLGQKQQK